MFVLLEPFHFIPFVLEPNFYLLGCEIEHLGQLIAFGSRKVSLLFESTLELEDLGLERIFVSFVLSFFNYSFFLDFFTPQHVFCIFVSLFFSNFDFPNSEIFIKFFIVFFVRKVGDFFLISIFF